MKCLDELFFCRFRWVSLRHCGRFQAVSYLLDFDTSSIFFRMLVQSFPFWDRVSWITRSERWSYCWSFE